MSMWLRDLNYETNGKVNVVEDIVEDVEDIIEDETLEEDED